LLLSHPFAKAKSQWCQVYFTSPPLKKIKANNPQVALIELINKATKSFNGAFFEISSKSIAQALIKAKKRRVKIKLVIDQDYYHHRIIDKMKRDGIEVRCDFRENFMHNKFAIIDNQIVWTGSYNLTFNGAWRNNNNALKITSTSLAKIYEKEFQEMFYDKIFGNKKEKGPFAELRKKNEVKTAGHLLKVFFSPEDNIEDIIIQEIAFAQKNIHFMLFSFTSSKIGEALIDKFNEGIKIYGLLEKRGSQTKYSQYIKMKIEGLPIKLDKNKGNMHHKVMIIDNKKVITGSFNFSKNANLKNDENIIILEDSKIARLYLKEFHKSY